MKHFIFITCIVLPVIFLYGCNTKANYSKQRPILNFTSDIDIVLDDMKISGNIVKSSEGFIKIDIISPENLSGLKIEHSNNENSITKNDLTYKSCDIILPSSSIIETIVNIFDYITSNPDEGPSYQNAEEMCFIGKTDSGKFELKADRKTGFIKQIKMEGKTTVNFSNQKIN